MQTNLQRTISLLTIVTVTFGIGLAAYDAGRRPTDANAGRTPVVSTPARPADAPAAPRFERSNEPAVEVDLLNAHGG